MDQNEIREEMKNYQCQNCGGAFIFDPESQKMKCERCGSVEDFQGVENTGGKLQKTSIKEYDFKIDELKDFEGWGNESRVFRCSSCGATTTLNKNDVATRCSFCGSAQVQSTNLSPGIKPESVISFQVSRQKAEQLFKNWLRGKFFAKTDSKKDQHIGKFNGIYLPFWTYSAKTDSFYVARVGKDKEDSEGKTYTTWSTRKGKYERRFKDVQISASETLPYNQVSPIYPYNMDELRPYNMNYLSGFTAERYSIGASDAFKTAQKVMDDQIRQDIRNMLMGERDVDHVDVQSVQTRMSDMKYKQILAPLWISAFVYHGKTYRFMVNGQTGKVSGSYPISYFKVALVITAVIIVLMIILFIMWKF